METVKRSRPEAKNWTLTLFAEDGVSLEDKEAWLNKPEIFKYAIFGRETCPDTGKKHLQCFVSLHTKKRLTAMQKLFPKAHLEIARGNPTQNIEYCSKVSRKESFYTSISKPVPVAERLVRATKARPRDLSPRFESHNPQFFFWFFFFLKK